MELFNKLGTEIENRWRSMDYDETRFPSLAAEALREARLPEKVSAWEVLEWTLGENELPRQMDVHGRFGDPPITLFVAPRFYIDVYFWFQGTTSIHQHAFCGAFQVLLGSSIHSWYDFELSEQVNSFVQIGDMSLRVCELLEVGAVQEIRAGRQYVHSLFHLDQPSATIVVRTEKSPLFLPQFDYHKPRLATDPFFHHDTTTKKIQVAGALLAADRSDADELISRMLADSDFHTTFLLLSALHYRLNSDRLSDMFGVEQPRRRRFDKFLDVVHERHGDKAGVLADSFAYRERIDDLVRRRSVVTDPEHRFFFALLLNVEGRDQIFSLIKQRFRDAEPIDKILDWAYDLSQIRTVTGPQSQNALGIPGFDDFDLYVLEAMLNGKDDGEIGSSIRSEYPAEKAEALLPRLVERVSMIRTSTTFGPLLAR